MQDNSLILFISIFASLSFLVPSVEQILQASIAGIKRNKQDESNKRIEKRMKEQARNDGSVTYSKLTVFRKWGSPFQLLLLRAQSWTYQLKYWFLSQQKAAHMVELMQ